MVTFQTSFHVNIQHDIVGMPLKYVNLLMLILGSFYVSILCLHTINSSCVGMLLKYVNLLMLILGSFYVSILCLHTINSSCVMLKNNHECPVKVNIRCPSPVIVTPPYEWKILQTDKNTQTNNKNLLVKKLSAIIHDYAFIVVLWI